MLINSIDIIKIELGEFDTLSKPEFVILKDFKSLLFEETQILKGNYTLFLRPRGFQLSANEKVIGIKYDDLQSVILSKEIIVDSFKERPILFAFLFGISFYILGGLTGDLTLTLHWLPTGLIIGLLAAKYFKKAVYSKTLTFTFNDKSTFEFLINYKDRNKVLKLLDRCNEHQS